jgi:hypothetical protein
MGLVLVAVLAVAVIAALLVIRGSELPPANGGYTGTVGDVITPTTTAARTAAVARHYLDEQMPELAAPNMHMDPIIHAVSAVRAADATALEPRIAPQAVADQPERVVWVVAVTGDFFNNHDLAWSRSGLPESTGTIVIDDATGTILGVYPHALSP